MNKLLRTIIMGSVLSFCIEAHAQCNRFHASTLHANGVPSANWRTDYPTAPPRDFKAPWLEIDFVSNPVKYMQSVLESVRNDFERSDQHKRLIPKEDAQWWISLWLDYGPFGREPRMGLTKERGPDPGDLSPTNVDGHQVWAVGFYNARGASVLGNVFSDPCNPNVPRNVKFPEGTVAIKFLFTDAPIEEVKYLGGAPEYEAFIDEAGAGSDDRPVTNRKPRELRLLQVDIATKDSDARTTNWVFGTFAWIGPKAGDGLFDNLIPVSLQWGNDPNVYDDNVVESWINSQLRGTLYGWKSRPHLGFNGRANGPADNIRSSCLSCHAAARVRRSEKGILNRNFDMTSAISDMILVKEHVDTWFTNLSSGSFFHPGSKRRKIAALDYSLQLDAAIWRMCQACQYGGLIGVTPEMCRKAGYFSESHCGMMASLLRPQSRQDPVSVSRPMNQYQFPPRQ
ncbi:MAG: hypothetical protein OXN90_13730 [Gemmatimonadota bacterium]|nr:hypothetical protein [Gemmatimonadota bacterium]